LGRIELAPSGEVFAAHGHRDVLREHAMELEAEGAVRHEALANGRVRKHVDLDADIIARVPQPESEDHRAVARAATAGATREAGAHEAVTEVGAVRRLRGRVVTGSEARSRCRDFRGRQQRQLITSSQAVENLRWVLRRQGRHQRTQCPHPQARHAYAQQPIASHVLPPQVSELHRSTTHPTRSTTSDAARQPLGSNPRLRELIARSFVRSRAMHGRDQRTLRRSESHRSQRNPRREVGRRSIVDARSRDRCALVSRRHHPTCGSASLRLYFLLSRAAKKLLMSRAEITTPEALADESVVELSLRPQRLAEFIGQDKVKQSLRIWIDAALARREPLDHAVFYGPPGLGKTTLAELIARELGVNIRTTSGPALEKPGDLVGTLTNLREGDILFIDEIHRLKPIIEEFLYPAMEDYKIEIRLSDGPKAQTITMPIERFTLIGATTRFGMLTPPMRARFGIEQRLNYYPAEDLELIVHRTAEVLKVAVVVEGAAEIARRSRGTPRIANRLLRRVRDYAQVKSNGTITRDVANEALQLLDVDQFGLDDMDSR